MANHTTSDVKVIVFQLAEEQYGVDIAQVNSIERVQRMTRVPHTAPFVKGVINLRGTVTPIVDLRKRFDLPDAVESDKSRLIVVTTRDMSIGLMVDAANDVIDVPIDDIEPAPAVIGGIEADYLRGVAKIDGRPLILLNLDRLFSSEEVELMSAVKR